MPRSADSQGLIAELPLSLKVWPDLGRALNVSRGVAYELVASGAIPSFRCGRSIRVSKDAVIAFMESGGTDAAPRRDGPRLVS